MDLEDRLSSTEPNGLADKATAETEVVSEKKELPLRLFFGNGPRLHKKLCIEWGVTNRRCEQCGKVGQLVCFSANFRKWALRRVTLEELNQTCNRCNERGHTDLDCDLSFTTQKSAEIPAPAPKKMRTVHCGLCGKVGHNRRTCLRARRD